MPSASKKPYKKRKTGELKTLQLQCDPSNTHSPSALGVLENQFEETQALFQDPGRSFVDFPGEIRNEIYKLVADYQIQKTDSRAITTVYSSYDWNWKKEKRLKKEGNPQLMILQPGLFLACRQFRDEGLPYFYQRRKFYLYLNHGKHILNLKLDQAGFSSWFQAIGDLGQQNIRHLFFRNSPMMKGIECLERIHRKLSDKATVVYTSSRFEFSIALWKVAAKYRAKNREKVPLFWSLETLKFPDLDGNPDSDDVVGCRLEFKPGFGWFGMALDDKAQLCWRRDKGIEMRNEEWLAICQRSRLQAKEDIAKGKTVEGKAESSHVPETASVEGKNSLTEVHMLAHRDYGMSEDGSM